MASRAVREPDVLRRLGRADDGRRRAALDTLVSRGAPLAFVWLAEGARPEGLAEALADRGAVPFELDAPTMVAELAGLDRSALERVPDGLANGVATLPEARGRGIGAAITLAPFRVAFEAGWSRAVIFATEMGAPVYRRIGFADTGSTISRYLWSR